MIYLQINLPIYIIILTYTNEIINYKNIIKSLIVNNIFINKNSLININIDLK